MANLFKGFKQVKSEYFLPLLKKAISSEARLEDKEAVIGYLWFVRTPAQGASVNQEGKMVYNETGDQNLLNDSYDIYFGTKHYGHFMQDEIPALAQALGEINKAIGLDADYGFTPSPTEFKEALDKEYQEHKGKHSVKDAIDYIFKNFVKSADFESFQTSNTAALDKKVGFAKTSNGGKQIDFYKAGSNENPEGDILFSLDSTEFIKDGMLEDVSVTTPALLGQDITYGTDESGQPKVYHQGIDGEKDTKFLYFKWNVDAPKKKEKTVKEDFVLLSDLTAVAYSADGKTIQMSDNNVFSVKEVNTNITKTNEAITIKGGPLADIVGKVYPDGVLPLGTDIQSLLVNLLCQEIWPNPSCTPTPMTVAFDAISTTLTDSGKTVEVGTQVKVSDFNGYNAKVTTAPKATYAGFDNGYSEREDGEIIPGNPKALTGETSLLTNKPTTIQRTHTGFTKETGIDGNVSDQTASNCSIVGKTLTVCAGENSITDTISGPGYSCKIPAQEGFYYYASNLNKLNPGKKIAKYGGMSVNEMPPANATKTLKVTGKRFAFVGTTLEAPSSIDSGFIRGLDVKKDYDGMFTLNIPDGTTRVFICIPSSWNKSLDHVIDTANARSKIEGAFVETSVDVNGANNFDAEGYKVYCYAPKTTLSADEYEVTFK